MHLVDNVYAVLSLRRRILHLVPDLADIIHAVVGGRIDLNHAHGRPGGNAAADRTFPTGSAVHRMLTVHSPREDLRNCGLTGTSRSAEKICVSDPAGKNLVL